MTEVFLTLLQFSELAFIFALFVFDTCFNVEASSPGGASHHQTIHLINNVAPSIFIFTNHSSSMLLILHGVLQSEIAVLAIESVTESEIKS